MTSAPGPNIAVPFGAPGWAAAIVKNVQQYVDLRFVQPIRLRKGVSTDRPLASRWLGCLIFETDTVGALLSDGTAWNKIVSYLTGTTVAVTNAGTINNKAGQLTTESLATAAGAAQTLTITNSFVAAADLVFSSVQNGTNNAGAPSVGRVTPGAGSFTIELRNVHASAAFNGTLIISFISV